MTLKAVTSDTEPDRMTAKLVAIQLIESFSPGGGGGFHSKVIGMLVVFLGYKNLILVFFRVFRKIFGKWKPFVPKQPSKLQYEYFLGV